MYTVRCTNFKSISIQMEKILISSMQLQLELMKLRLTFSLLFLLIYM